MKAAPARSSGASPGALYAAGVAAGDWQDDPAQQPALAAFDRLWHALHAPRPRWRLRPPPAPQGMYLWGQVGRGKTFLMDLFHQSLGDLPSRRVHFHRFLREVHESLRALEGERDPLQQVAAGMARAVRVLCLDEFHVRDIGDAMILGNLLEALFARGVVLVTTSNTPPAGLYAEGLQRERFLPAIDVLEHHCQVVELAAGRDWRLRALQRAPVYLVPHGADSEREMAALFARLADGAAAAATELVIHGRPIPVRALAAEVAWFDFEALCEGPRAVADYIELARRFAALMVSAVPQFTPAGDDPARRFIELVDEAYDRGVKLILSAATPVVELYDGERLRAEFARTESRLIEMQSEDYLARAHRP